MADAKKIFRLSKQRILLVSVILFLLLLTWFLRNRIAHLMEENRINLAALKQVVPGFDERTLEKFEQDKSRLEAELLAFAYVYDPPDKEIKKDYDLPIYFVEELGKAKQSLKAKADDKKISYPDLGFKETLPDEKEARYLLKQLYVIKEALNLGMEAGVNFISVIPQPVEDLGISAGIKLAKIRAEFTASGSALINFLIRLSETVPLDSVEHILIKAQDSTLKADMTLSYLAIEADWKDKIMTFTPLNIKEIFSQEEKTISSLRANNPFGMYRAQEPKGLPAQAPVEQSKDSPRFLYLGKAVLKSKEAAVIEDTLNQETVFLTVGERTGDFMVKELNELQIILKNTNSGQETIIKRQEQ